MIWADRTKTDTGSQEENSKVYERFMTKELGKIIL